MTEPSWEYYLGIFRKSPQNMSTVRTLLLNDFKSMESKLSEAVERNDLSQMRKQLHRIRPIVYNLRFTKMLNVLDKYEHTDATLWERGKMSDEVGECLAEIYHFLEKPIS